MKQLMIEPSPHIKSGNSTRNIMLSVIIALLPALGMATWIFGIMALVNTVICCTACVIFEALFNLITKREQSVYDLSAIITGMLLAFNLPVTLPIYMIIIGAFVSIVIVKMLFGGIGQNFANPAIVGRIVLMLSFTSHMTSWVEPFWYTKPALDAVTTATPLVTEEELPSLLDMFFGFRGGCIGETSIAALLIGFLFLVAIRVVNPAASIAFVGTVAVGYLISGSGVEGMLYGLMSGGLILGACFMATDYATTPITTKGKFIFGVGCGLITVVIRLFASLPEGVSYSILLMNLLSPYIEMLVAPKPFGFKKEAKKV